MFLTHEHVAVIVLFIKAFSALISVLAFSPCRLIYCCIDSLNLASSVTFIRTAYASSLTRYGLGYRERTTFPFNTQWLWLCCYYTTDIVMKLTIMVDVSLFDFFDVSSKSEELTTISFPSESAFWMLGNDEIETSSDSPNNNESMESIRITVLFSTQSATGMPESCSSDFFICYC